MVPTKTLELALSGPYWHRPKVKTNGPDVAFTACGMGWGRDQDGYHRNPETWHWQIYPWCPVCYPKVEGQNA